MSEAQEFFEQVGELLNDAKIRFNEAQKSGSGLSGAFVALAKQMYLIRATAQQSGVSRLGYIAGLAEDLAYFSAREENRPRLRKCLGSLWDAVTTLEYLIRHSTDEPGEEETILIRRLERALRLFKNPRTKMNQADIAALFRSKPSRNG